MQRFGGRNHISMSPKIATAIRSITPVLPDGSSAYVFGSASRSDCYADVDLLILYDSSFCPAARTHAEHKAFVDRVERLLVRLSICVCFLTAKSRRAISLRRFPPSR